MLRIIFRWMLLILKYNYEIRNAVLYKDKELTEELMDKKDNDSEEFIQMTSALNEVVVNERKAQDKLTMFNWL